MKTVAKLFMPAVAGLLLFASPSQAEIAIEAGTTIVGQQTSKQNNSINKDVLGSVDLVIDADIGPGTLHIYGEGSTTPSVSASDVIAGSNADAGTALNKNGQGRVQLSEISYSFALGSIANDAFNVSFGVQDLTVFTDATAISNDEASQFLADALVNNPSIAFPDYTPSFVVNYGAEDAMNFRAMIANAYGLADNPNANYADLFEFGRDNNTGLNKGIFALAEARLPGETTFTLGGWTRTSELPRHLGGANKSSAFGIYANVDGAISESTLWSARAGWNSAKDTDEVTTHASFAVEHAYREDHVIAVGVAWSGLSSDFKSTFANAANPIVAELYYRWQINEFIAISPDIQYWSHANNLSTSTAGSVGGSAWVYGLRIQIGGSHRMAHFG